MGQTALVLMWVVLAPSVALAKPARNEALRQTLVKMGQEDQADALAAMKGTPVPDEAAHTQARIALLRQILAEHGWPGVSLVGEDGAQGAWLVAQHDDDDPAFQRECLTKMEAAFKQGEVLGAHLAYLTDRVLSAEHKPQLYGTQGAPIYSDAEKAQVNARRKKLGLPTMEETARQRGRMYERAMMR